MSSLSSDDAICNCSILDKPARLRISIGKRKINYKYWCGNAVYSIPTIKGPSSKKCQKSTQKRAQKSKLLFWVAQKSKLLFWVAQKSNFAQKSAQKSKFPFLSSQKSDF